MAAPLKYKPSDKPGSKVAAPDAVRIKLVISFDGAAYAGWQVQKSGVGVQEKIEEALRRLFPSVKRIVGSSRTDTGVHARGMVAHVDILKTEFRMPIRRLRLALNAWLPEDVRIVDAFKMPADFHAQYQAAGKEYRYTFWNHACMNPLLRAYAWHVPHQLDVAAMKAAAGYFVGEHNFRSFAGNPGYERTSYVRTLTRCELKGRKPEFTVFIEGDGFLYKMCRNIVGTIVHVGQGKMAPEDIPHILDHQDRRRAGETAPAHGLVLWEVKY